MNKKLKGIMLIEFALFVISSLAYHLFNKEYNVYIILLIINLIVVGCGGLILLIIKGLDLIMEDKWKKV